jgi:hypothetical protein
MEIITITKVILSLIFVIAIMYLTLKMMQKYTKFGQCQGSSLTSIKVENITYIDENNKIVHISQNKANYVLAINKNNILLIDKYETNPL